MIAAISLLIPLLVTTTVSVCSTGCDFNTISQAIREVAEGGTVNIKAGEYREQLPLVVDRPLSIVGEQWPIIRGDGAHDIILVKASGVSVRGVELNDTGYSYVHELAGVRVEDSSNCKIVENRLNNNAYAIYLANSKSCEVRKNVIQGTQRSESESGNGIHSWSGEGHRFVDNRVTGHRDGIYLEFTHGSEIAQNRISANIRYGLHFMTSHRNSFSANEFTENGAGVAVMYSREIKMRGNIFANNRGAAAYGMLLKDIVASEILENRFHDNTFGIYMEGTNRSKFTGNYFQENGYGLRVFGDCDDNTFARNNFAGNTFDVVTNSSRNPNLFSGNYWSQYRGYDLDRDGVGDQPYYPVSLSSVLVEKLDTTYSLINSPLFLILDQIEQALPMLIPDSIKDENPLMQPSEGR